MLGATLLLVLLATDGGAAPAADGDAQLVIQAGETLEKAAKRALGDEKAALELRALNPGLDGGSAPAGTALKLPGPDRALALSALIAARNAVTQADSTQVSREQAAARLAEAEELFQSARYAEAAQAADGAWQLVSAKAKEPTRFAVAVDTEGTTHVTSQSGKAVRVEGEGVAQQVYAGQEVKVEKGKAPPVPETQRVPAELVSPAPAARLKQTRNGKPVAIALVWSAVAGSKGYLVQITPAKSGKPRQLKTRATRALLPALPAGEYLWTVRSVFGKGELGEAPAERGFELLDEPLRLEVGQTKWK